MMVFVLIMSPLSMAVGLIDFIDNKLDSPLAKYAKADVSKVLKGLEGYTQYIQHKIVSPGLLEFNGGDKGMSKAMQAQVDDYKKTLVTQFEARYPQIVCSLIKQLPLIIVPRKLCPAAKS